MVGEAICQKKLAIGKQVVTPQPHHELVRVGQVRSGKTLFVPTCQFPFTVIRIDLQVIGREALILVLELLFFSFFHQKRLTAMMNRSDLAAPIAYELADPGS